MTAAFELTVAAGERQRRASAAACRAALRHAGLRHGQRLGRQRHDRLGRAAGGHAVAAARALQILIGPSVERSLLDVLLGPAAVVPARECAGSPRGSTSATSDLMAAVGLQKLLAATRDAGGPQAQALDARIRSALEPARLVAERRRRLELDRAAAARAIASPRPASCGRCAWPSAAGYSVAQTTLRQGRCATWPARSPPRPRPITRARPSCCTRWPPRGQGDFALANRLLPQPAGAVQRGAGAPGAGACRDGPHADGRRSCSTCSASATWTSRPSRRTTALGLAALEQSASGAAGAVRPGPAAGRRPTSPKAKELVDWLLAHRTGHRWSPEKATGPATLALCDWFAADPLRRASTTSSPCSSTTRRSKLLDIDDRRRHADDRRAGRSCSRPRASSGSTSRSPAAGVSPISASSAASSRPTSSRARRKDWNVRRLLRAGPAGTRRPGNSPRLRHAARQLSTRSATRSRSCRWASAASVRTGDLARQRLPADTPEEQLEYLVVTEPLPSGATVIEKSVTRRLRALRDHARRDHVLHRQPAARRDRSTSTCTATCRASTGRRRRSSATPTGPTRWPSRRRSR